MHERFDLDVFVELDLYDPNAEHAAEREELLKLLVAEGCTVDEMVEADRRGRLFALAGDRLLVPGPVALSLAQIAERVGIRTAAVATYWRGPWWGEPPRAHIPRATPKEAEDIEAAADIAPF